MKFRGMGVGAAAAILAVGWGAMPAIVQAQTPLKISRANLAKSASFTVTQTLAPKGGAKIVRTYSVEVSGNRARLDYDDPAVGSVRYLASEKGVFFYIPGNKSAVKQTFKGGVEEALNLAFSQANDQLAHAKKIGSEIVSGQPTDVYKDPQTGTILYVGKKPGFKLPVKSVLSNEGGTSTVLVTAIKLNVPIAASRFALPAGTQIMDGGAAGGGLPGGLPVGGGR